jgi:ribonucleoside-diphosphate reductase alpha chain
MSKYLTDNARTILAKRYLDEGETPDDLWSRVSGGKKEYRELLEELLFLPNSPTLFNAGKSYGGTLSACFVFDIDDALLGDWPKGGCDTPFPNSILGTTFKAACVAKAGGGVGYYLGNIREEGALVNSTHRKACGPVGVLKWLHNLRSLITQGGKRDLAQMAVLPVEHKDILKFIHCKDEDPKALESFNISVSWKNSWLKRVDWDIAHAKSFEGQPNRETALWNEQCQSAWRTGDPGMLFWDTINRFNMTPHLGDINATNPCGETPNLNNEPCNLGSIALRRFVQGGKILWDKLRETVHVCIRFLDDILDWNIFPHPDITQMALATRKLGLGVMGWADMLALLRIPYASQEAVDLGKEVMCTIDEVAEIESHRLATIKGPYPAWETGDKSKPWFRNSTRTSIAPTGTISIIAGCEPSIEPHYALERTRTTHEGIVMKERIQDWLGDLGGFIPQTAMEIAPEWHIKHQAAFQRHTNLGVSKTVNLPNSATVKDVSDAYKMMWELGCKGGTVYRDGCRSEQVLVTTAKKSVYSTRVTSVIDDGKGVDQSVFGFADSFQIVNPKMAPPSPQEISMPERQTTITRDEPYTPSPGGNGTHHGSVDGGEKSPARGTGVSANGRKKLPDDCESVRHKFRIGGVHGYIHVGLYEDGTPGEVFIRGSKFGSTLGGMLDSWCMLLSNALQRGTPVDELVRLHGGARFEPSGMTGNKDIPVATSIPDYVVRFLATRFKKNNERLLYGLRWWKPTEPLPEASKEDLKFKPVNDNFMVQQVVEVDEGVLQQQVSGDTCPDCGSMLVDHGGCKNCVSPQCGYSKCG